MARYKVSNRNIYGFNTRPLLTFGICIPLIMAFGLAVSFWVAPLFYEGYVAKYTVEEGAPGHASAADTPAASSIADMERLSDGFTFQTTGTVLNYDKVRVGEAIYHFLTLDSGERVIAHINRKALTETGEAGVYRLPVGVWREWETPEEVQIYTTLADSSHYIDMYGDYVPIVPLEDYSHAMGSRALTWAFVLGLMAFRVVGVRRWRFAPALLASRDPLLPRNDLECWCAATFAIWSHSFTGMEGFPLITGTRGTRKQVKRFRESLAESWGIRSREEGLETVHELTDAWAGALDTTGAGWDLCRATQLLGMMYLVKMITRDELDREFSRAGRVIQRSFSSWDALVESYLSGFGGWVSATGRDGEQEMRFRRGIYEKLKGQHFSAYSIPWNTDISWLPGVSGGGRTVTKQLLRHYMDDYGGIHR